MAKSIKDKNPVQPKERIDFVDILRGFAVFGILVANMASYSGHVTGIRDPIDMLDHSILVLIRFLITAKFYSLFSFLFGWGMSVQLDRAGKKGIKFTPLYLRRLIILLLIGVVHGIFIWNGDILTLYALLGFLLLILRNRSEKVLVAILILSLLVAILIRAPGETMTTFRAWYENTTSFMRHDTYPETLYTTGSYAKITQLRLQEFINGHSWTLFYFGNVFGMFVLGLIIGKRKIFQEVDNYLSLIRKVFWIGLFVGVLANGLFVWMDIHPSWRLASWIPADYNQMIQRTFYTIGAPALMLFYVSGIILLLQKETWRKQLSPLGNVGRMALSNYLLQSLVFTLIFYNYGLGIYGQISPTIGLILTIVFFILQIRLSRWWFDRYRFGPMEWLWRTLTYGKLQQLIPGEYPVDIKSPNFFQRYSHLYTKINPRASLVTAWLILLLWTGILFNWSARIETENHLVDFSQDGVQVTSTPLLDSLNPDAVSEVNSNLASSLPKVRTITSSNNPLASSGDVLALVDTFEVDQAIAQIETLSSFPYLGRQAGSPEGHATGDYIAEEYKKYGLQPFGENGTFFQNFTATFTPLSEIPTFEIEEPDGTINNDYKIYQDYSPIIRWYAGSGETQGPVYWVNDCSKDQFAEIDVVGKIILCEPGDHTDWMVDSLRNTLEHGAYGLLLIGDPLDRPPDFASPTKDIWIPETIPAFWVYPELIQGLLSGSGKTLEDLSLSTETYPLKTQVNLKVSIDTSGSCPGTRCPARNVLGILPGRDPGFASEVVILGAHYDHMGQGPDGTIWSGANDNASGVAVLLEIARSWQEQGYVPRRSVIFAAWDAEEIGLLGSRHYVETPLYPLANTLAMIQLDMVGAGTETLSIDGDSELSDHIERVAQMLEVPTSITHIGRSDHTPFLEAGIPSSLLIWYGDETSAHYHQPADTIEVINPPKLENVAKITQITILDIVESAPAITNLLARRSQAAETGDLTSFLSTSHIDQNEIDRIWFNDLMTLSPTSIEIEANELIITGEHAQASTNINIEYLEAGSEGITQTLSAKIPAQLSLDSNGWKWAGPYLQWHNADDLSETSHLTVAIPPGAEISIDGIVQTVSEQYKDIATTLNLPTYFDAKLFLMPDAKSIQASTALSLPDDQSLWVGPGIIKLVYRKEITSSQQLKEAVVKLVLADAGIQKNVAPWLWHGLPAVFQARTQSIYVQERYLPSLQNALLAGDTEYEPASSWAATDYLYKQIGWIGLGQFISQLGQICQEGECTSTRGLDSVLLDTIQLDSQGFEAVWRDQWRMQLDSANKNLNQVLSTRTSAIINVDEVGFLSTVDQNIPNLLNEERGWFDEIKNDPISVFTQEAQPLALLEDGSILARVKLSYSRNSSDTNTESSATQKILFTSRESGYKWSGPLFNNLPGTLVDIRYPVGEDDLAGKLLSNAEIIYPQLAASLNIEKPNKVTITLYKIDDNFNTSISLSYPKSDSAAAWTNQGSNIKIKLIPNTSVKDYIPALATQLSRNLLRQIGVTSEWLISGVSSHLSKPYDQGRTHDFVGTNLVNLAESAKAGRLTPLNIIQPIYLIPESQQNLINAQTWDAVNYLITSYGWPALLDILHSQHQGINFNESFRNSTGLTLDDFEDGWRYSLSNDHILDNHIDTALEFNQDIAMQHVDYLSSSELAGRQAGSQGDTTAAAYIADKFETYGLIPVGDQTSITIKSNQDSSNRSDSIQLNSIITETISSYYQTFPISYTLQIADPQLELINNESNSVIELKYRQDYLIIQPSSNHSRTSVSDLVWVGEEGYQGINLNGRIALRNPVGELSEEIAKAVKHGAGGLLIAGTKQDDDEIFRKSPLTNVQTSTNMIPVYELTLDGYNRILDTIGHTHKSLKDFAGIYPLELRLRNKTHLSSPKTVDTKNILGLLPGSDPFLSRETIIIGAHYDHVGDDPDGTRYSGGNDDASGIGVLLEIVRLWQETGFQPKHSILFAAWGAQEMGNLGSEFYVNHPALPLELTNAMIQLDGVGGGDGFNLGAQALWESDGILLFYLEAAGNALGENVVVTQPIGNSDHLPFQSEGLPTVLLSWRLASEDNLPDSMANTVHPERLEVSGRVTTLLLMNLSQ